MPGELPLLPQHGELLKKGPGPSGTKMTPGMMGVCPPVGIVVAVGVAVAGVPVTVGVAVAGVPVAVAVAVVVGVAVAVFWLVKKMRVEVDSSPLMTRTVP